MRLSISEHEQRLLQYRQSINYLPHKGESYQPAKKRNPYSDQGEEETYFALIGRFAIDFEKTYLNWLYETLNFLEKRQRENGQEHQDV